MKKIYLVIVDPQNDFCDPKGALYIPNAEKDIQRLADMICKHKKDIHHIQVTMDSHYWVHIAHPVFWEGKDGKSPQPLTLIKSEDVIGDKPLWRARHAAYRERAKHYVKQLEANGRYTLCIWPPHCIFGTWGHNVHSDLNGALKEYQEVFGSVKFSFKGSNLFTEHYSAVKADVVDPADPSTNIDLNLIDMLAQADEVLFAGEALSHCVANTMHDVLKHLGHENAEKFVILKDASSNIPGFEAYGNTFLKEMDKLGLKTTTTEDYF